MCGILGTVDRPFDEGLLSLIRHRGPDDHGILSLRSGPHDITLGHTRLSIVDLSANGHQPMQAEDGDYAIVFNGEVYNHQELRRQIPQVAFRGTCDTETVLRWLRLRSMAGLAALNGIFALALIDRLSGKLYLARDPFGVKPLYYCEDGGQFVFSSEIRPIRRLVEDDLDLDSLAELLRVRYLPAPDTLFTKIRKVRPGHVVEVDLTREALRVREYPFTACTPETASLSFESALEQYGELMARAVERQLMSDVEVGVLLSGGIDSALVATLAQNRSPRRLKAFTVGYSEQDDSDEISPARETAELLGMEHRTARIGCDDFYGSIRRLVSIIEEPLATTSVIPMDYLSQLAARDVKVVLCGQGADESNGGYRRYQSEVLREYIPPFVWRAFRRLPRAVASSNDTLERAWMAAGIPDDLERFLAVYSVFSGPEIERLIGHRDERSLTRLRYAFELLRCGERSRSVERMMAMDLRMNLADDLLLYTDKVTMHYSLECRVPLLDLDLIRFIESLPRDYRLRLRCGKYLHKKYGRRVLPERIVNRGKKGFLSPAAAWFRRNGALREVLLDRGSKFAAYFDLNRVERCVLAHEAGHSRERHLFLLLTLNYWMSEFL